MVCWRKPPWEGNTVTHCARKCSQQRSDWPHSKASQTCRQTLKSAAFSRHWMITRMKLQFAKMYLCTGLFVFFYGGCACSPHACLCYLKQLNVPPLTCSDFSLQKPSVGNFIPSLLLKGVEACFFFTTLIEPNSQGVLYLRPCQLITWRLDESPTISRTPSSADVP